ncbi:Lon-like protease helical domain-containing protein [Guyparkeria sp.]|uniref:Lon-like protease helical domain-containing protein n=1 Tax=Guyparkeria sp. TaxID=2035736 RepID=UPI0039708718
MVEAPTGLEADQFYRACPASSLPFETTGELDPPSPPLGQQRALEALSFGTEISDDRFDLYALGATGSGKYGVVRDFLNRRAKRDAPPPSWAYVFNFDDPDTPRLLKLPARSGRDLEADLSNLIDEFRTAIPAVF